MDAYRTLIITGVISVLFYFLKKAGKKKPEAISEKEYILILPKFYLIFGIICSSFILIILPIALFNIEGDGLPIIAGILLFFGGLGALLIIMYLYTYKIYVFEDRIEQKTLSGDIKVIKWKDIVDVKYGKISQVLKIKSERVTIKTHSGTKGYHMFLSDLIVNTKENDKVGEIPMPGA